MHSFRGSNTRAAAITALLASFAGACAPAPPTPAEILQQGAAAWNQWRVANPGITPDLDGIVLDGATLAGANFESATLLGSSLRGTRLAGATFANADLTGAELEAADLSGTNFAGADLSYANLEGANLTGADLGGALLTGADLSNATIDALQNWDSVAAVNGANIYRVVRAPSGFKDFALANGARKDG